MPNSLSIEEDEECAFLILGCYGKTDKNGFVLCPGTYNVILKLSKNTTNIKAIIKYLKNMYLHLYPLNENSGVIATIKFINQQGIWSLDVFQSINNFIEMHHSCGLYLCISK